MARKKRRSRTSPREGRNVSRARAGTSGRGYGRGGVGRSFGQAGGARGGASGGLFGMLSSLFGGAAHGGGMGGGGMGGGGGAAPFTGLSSSAEGRFVPPSMTTHPQFIPPGLTLVDMLQADPEGRPFGPGGVWDVPGGGAVSSGGGAGAVAQAPMIAPRMAVQQAPVSGFGGASGGGGGITPQPTSGTHRWGGARGTNWANNPNNPNSTSNQVVQEGANQIFRQTAPTNQFSSTSPGNISTQGRIVRTGQASPGVTGTYNAPKNNKPPKQVGGRPVT